MTSPRASIQPLRRRPVLALAALVVLAAIALAASASRDDEEGTRPGVTIGEVARSPERYAGRTVTVTGSVSRVGSGRFVIASGRGVVLVVPGLRDRTVRVAPRDVVRVTGTVRPVDEPPDPRAAPIPDYDGDAVIVPERVERVTAGE